MTRTLSIKCTIPDAGLDDPAIIRFVKALCKRLRRDCGVRVRSVVVGEPRRRAKRETVKAV